MNQRLKSTPGFTIVELVITVIVVAVLASLAYVAYRNVSDQAVGSVLRSDLKNASTRLDIIRVTDGTYPVSDPDIQKSNGTNYQYSYDSDNDSYCLTATSDKSQTAVYHISSSNKIPVEGACEGHSGPGDSEEPEIISFTQISAGDGHTCGIADGQAYCWGNGGSGKLGNGSTSNQTTPVAVDTSLMSGEVVAISSGDHHTCAIADSQAYCWGMGSEGRLGNGSTSNQTTPVAVDTSLMSGEATSVAAGSNHTCAIADGQAYCWGYASSGQIGNGSTSQQNAPAAVSTSVMSSAVSSVSAGSSYTCAIADGQAYCWGNGGSGRLGNGATSNQTTPVAVSTSIMSGVVTVISAGQQHTCAIADGQAYCWGNGGSGRLGNGSSIQQTAPVTVDTSLMSGTVTNISAGDLGAYTCAIAGGQAYCWGGASNGQLGSGDTLSQATPVAVNTSLMSSAATHVSTGSYHTCAIAGGQAYCWGNGGEGRLGNGATSQQNTPVQVSDIP